MRSSPDLPSNADRGEVSKFDALAARFWDPRGEFRPLHLLNPVRLGFIARHASLAGARALDVGCGGGLLSEALARSGAAVSGIDLAPGMIEVARLHAAEQCLRIDYRVATAEELAASLRGTGAEAALAASFDVITCMEMLEHVPQPALTLAALAALLRPGGSLFVSTLNRNLGSFLRAIVAAEYVLRLLPRGTHEYARFIRPSELARSARAVGLAPRFIAGIELNPYSESCRLTRNPSVNYLMYLERARD